MMSITKCVSGAVITAKGELSPALSSFRHVRIDYYNAYNTKKSDNNFQFYFNFLNLIFMYK